MGVRAEGKGRPQGQNGEGRGGARRRKTVHGRGALRALYRGPACQLPACPVPRRMRASCKPPAAAAALRKAAACGGALGVRCGPGRGGVGAGRAAERRGGRIKAQKNLGRFAMQEGKECLGGVPGEAGGPWRRRQRGAPPPPTAGPPPAKVSSTDVATKLRRMRWQPTSINSNVTAWQRNHRYHCRGGTRASGQRAGQSKASEPHPSSLQPRRSGAKRAAAGWSPSKKHGVPGGREG